MPLPPPRLMRKIVPVLACYLTVDGDRRRGRMPSRTQPPRIEMTVMRMSLSITISSPTRRARTSMGIPPLGDLGVYQYGREWPGPAGRRLSQCIPEGNRDARPVMLTSSWRRTSRKPDDSSVRKFPTRQAAVGFRPVRRWTLGRDSSTLTLPARMRDAALPMGRSRPSLINQEIGHGQRKKDARAAPTIRRRRTSSQLPSPSRRNRPRRTPVN